jgi:hypothetical protein
MNRTAIVGFAILACLSLPACNSATVASGPRLADASVASAPGAPHSRQLPNTARRIDPMRSSASYNGVASRAAAPQTNAMVPLDNRYDSGCRAKYRAGSSEYGGCLQGLPARALVGGGER